MEGRPLPIYGDGKQIRDWLYVEDHVKALMYLIGSGHIGESYCIGAENELTNLELVKLICKILDQKKPKNISYNCLIQHVADRPGHDFRYSTDATKLRSHTPWKAEKGLKDGLEKTVEWYLEHFSKLSSNDSARRRIGVIV